MTNDVWQVLASINVQEKIQKRGDFNYLSWADAWGLLKGSFPDASFEKHWFENAAVPNKVPYSLDGLGFAYVSVTVTVRGHSLTEVFPVLDHRNNAVKNPNAFQINTSLQRCLVKTIACHGLGHNVYAGEDLPTFAGEDLPTFAGEEKPLPVNEPSGLRGAEVADRNNQSNGKVSKWKNTMGVWTAEIVGSKSADELRRWKHRTNDERAMMKTEDTELWTRLSETFEKQQNLLGEIRHGTA